MWIGYYLKRYGLVEIFLSFRGCYNYCLKENYVCGKVFEGEEFGIIWEVFFYYCSVWLDLI